MTGSESPSKSASKGHRRPKSQQKDGSCKAADASPTDKLRRLAIKNSYGNKSDPALLSEDTSSITVPSNAPLQPPEVAVAVINVLLQPPEVAVAGNVLLPEVAVAGNALLQLPEVVVAGSTTAAALDEAGVCKISCSSDIEEQEQALPQTSSSAGSPKWNPYITRQELMHSLRRTCSNLSVGLTQTQTICSGNSSYIHHTPRHLLRTHFSSKPSVARSATMTAEDAGLWASDDTRDSDESCDGQETQSLVNMPPSRSLVAASRSRGRQVSPLHVGVKLPPSHDSKYHQVSGSMGKH